MKMGKTLCWMNYLLLFTFYHGVVKCQQAQGRRLNSDDSLAADYPNIQAQSLLQRHPLWYKHFRPWESQVPRQENMIHSAYGRDSLYHLEREQFKENTHNKFLSNNAQPNIKSLNQPYQSMREMELNNKERSSEMEERKPEGQITVKVYNSPSVKDVEEEEYLENSAGRDSTILSASHSVQNIIEHLKQEKKSPEPIQDESASPLLYATNNSPAVQFQKSSEKEKASTPSSFSDVYFVAIVAGCSAVAIFGVIASGYCFYKLQKRSKAAVDVDYPAYGVTGPSKDTTSPNGDRKLAQSAQMYHYQHQKQQMIAVEKATSTHHASTSDVDSEEENEEGDYTVYECPGLAPTGEMEVKNPLFNDDSTPISPPVVTPKLPEK